MPNNTRIDKIFADVKGKVIKHAYIPKSIRDNYHTATSDDKTYIIVKNQDNK